MANAIGLSRRKRMAFLAICLLILYLLVELLSLCAHRLHYGRWYTWSSAAIQRRTAAATFAPDSIPDFPPGAVHPYIGYVAGSDWHPDNPDFKYPFLWADEFTNHPPDGFRSRRPVVQRRSPGTIIVGVFGGSVADIYHRQGIHVTLQKLREHKKYSDKKFLVVSLADGGYKQPQQLMALNYVLAQAGQFDILINIDGFNEVALHAAENGKKGVFPIYPRAWYFKVGQVRDSRLLSLFGRKALAEQAIRGSAGFFSHWPLSYSPFCHLIWRVRSRQLENGLREVISAIENYQTEESFLSTGPGIHPATQAELYANLVQIWEESSKQMQALCRANDIQYFHFLQPNQYDKGSKPLTADELKNAFLENYPYRPGVERGYPLLREAGQRLVASGEHFVDLTDIFKTTRESVYADTCCHLNERGNEIIATRIAEAIIADLPPD